MLKVIAQDFIKPEHIDRVLPFYKELVEKTRQEPDCIAYDLFTDRHHSGHFVFIEEWPDQAALDRHCQSEHFTRLVPLIDSLQEREGAFLFMDGVEIHAV